MTLNIIDAYHIALAAYYNKKMEEDGHPSLIHDFLKDEAEEAWEMLTPSQRNELLDFSLRNCELFDAFPESFSNDGDMERRQEVIDAIEDKLYEEIIFIE